MANVKVTILGCGSSLGVPVIGCDCPVCLSPDSKNHRLRSSIFIEMDQTKLLVDVTPDFRQQALRQGIKDLDAVFVTHCHADHVHGIDDIRPFNFFHGKSLPFYCDENTADKLRENFKYIFSCTPSTVF